MKKWVKIDKYDVSKIKPYARRKIRLQKTWGGREIWVRWDKKEGCFFWNSGEDAVYVNDQYQCPTHILVG